MDFVESIVVGGGVIGLAAARALAIAGREVLVLEAGGAIGTETSSRNSEVIHAGLYYPQGSLKARLCVPGRRALYAYCQEHGVPHRRCGKLVVATSEAETEKLDEIMQRGRANGVDDLRWLTASEARALEPALHCVAALYSPSTGIIDSHAFMQSLMGDAEAAGAIVALRSPVVGGAVAAHGITLSIGGRDPLELGCSLLVNCAGLHATRLVASIEGFPVSTLPDFKLAKGSYFVLSARSPFSSLVYPVPVRGGLGVHLTLDLGGAARFGPDFEWVDAIDYDVDPRRATSFYEAIRRYWPRLPNDSLHPGYAGIRPKASRAGSENDFIIEGPEAHAVPGVINLFGIESPGLTAALAIGDLVTAMAKDEA